MVCKYCGTIIDDTCNVCPECGTILNGEAVAELTGNALTEPETVIGEETLPLGEEPVFDPEDPERELTKREKRQLEIENAINAKSRVALLSTRDIVWSWILMSIPVIGTLFAIAWACGLCRKAERKFLARAFLILLCLVLILCAAGTLVYKFLFHLTLADLPAVITGITDWAGSFFAGIFG